MIYCQVHGAQRTEMPTEEDKWLKFTDISKQLKVPFVVYADFESILERLYGCQPDPNKSSTTKLAKHVPSCFTYKVVGVSPETTENHVTYRGEDAVEKFMDHMVKLNEKLVSILRNPKPMNLSDQESESFLKATHCCICKDQLGNDTVRDHCHVTGKKRYEDCASLCFTDRDSLCYDISTDDLYEDMKQDQSYFDFSDYPETHKNHSNANKKVLGKMKDECSGHVMREFVGLKIKMYSFVYEKKIPQSQNIYQEEKKRAKGVS